MAGEQRCQTNVVPRKAHGPWSMHGVDCERTPGAAPCATLLCRQGLVKDEGYSLVGGNDLDDDGLDDQSLAPAALSPKAGVYAHEYAHTR